MERCGEGDKYGYLQEEAGLGEPKVGEFGEEAGFPRFEGFLEVPDICGATSQRTSLAHWSSMDVALCCGGKIRLKRGATGTIIVVVAVVWEDAGVLWSMTGKGREAVEDAAELSGVTAGEVAGEAAGV